MESTSSIPPMPNLRQSMRQKSITEQDLLNDTNGMAADVTMEDVARIMREGDAHLLESMHFEQSCSTGETPVLASIAGNLEAVEDIPFLFEAKLGEPVVTSLHRETTTTTSSFNKGQLNPAALRRTLSLGDENRDSTGSSSVFARRFSHGDQHDNPLVYRQCLSGEIKSFRANLLPSPKKTKPLVVAEETAVEDSLPEGEETTASSTCCSHDATVSPSMAASAASVATSPGDHKRRNSSNDRRMSEAVQFAEAVGEMPPMDSNELCIIEEDDDDDTDDDDDEDDGNGTVIRLDEIASLNDHFSVVDNASQDPRSVDAKSKTSVTGEDEIVPTNDIPREIVKRKSRPRWPMQLPGWTFSHLETPAHTKFENTMQDYVYKGIHSNPPEIVKRGIQRGNHVQLHRKAWLEVSDKYHRYGKNLRLYYRHWESLGYPTNMFFDWLDSKGEAAGQPLPNLEECPRSKLDSDTVLYISNQDVTSGYALSIVTIEGRARFLDVDGELVQTGSDGWIFVLRDGVIYGAEKVTSISGQSKQRFHHSSFFGGKAVAAAGIIITDDDGFLTRLYPHSGHYRPRESHMQRLLYFLYHSGVDLKSFQMDVQQIMHASRDAVDNKNKEKEKSKKKDKGDIDSANNNNVDNNGVKKEGEKKKKVDSLQLMPAVSVAFYVAHKAHFIGEGIFAQIHQIRNANVTSVSEALALVNNGETRKKGNGNSTATNVQ